MQIQQLSYSATDLQLRQTDRDPARQTSQTDCITCLCKPNQMQINICQYPMSSIRRVGFSLKHVQLRVNSMLAVWFSCHEGQQVWTAKGFVIRAEDLFPLPLLATSPGMSVCGTSTIPTSTL